MLYDKMVLRKYGTKLRTGLYAFLPEKPRKMPSRTPMLVLVYMLFFLRSREKVVYSIMVCLL